MSALDELIIEHTYNQPGQAKACSAELAQLRTRNAELEEYHGFYNGTIPPGEPTVEEIKLRTSLAETTRLLNAAVAIMSFEDLGKIPGIRAWLEAR